MAPKIETASAGELVPRNADLDSLRKAAEDCKACDLWKIATQTVFGEGSLRAKIVLIGEQPGNDEDLSGRPFVGPAKVYATSGIGYFQPGNKTTPGVDFQQVTIVYMATPHIETAYICSTRK
jgi:uracil-DNA glycosylase